MSLSSSAWAILKTLSYNKVKMGLLLSKSADVLTLQRLGYIEPSRTRANSTYYRITPLGLEVVGEMR